MGYNLHIFLHFNLLFEAKTQLGLSYVLIPTAFLEAVASQHLFPFIVPAPNCLQSEFANSRFGDYGPQVLPLELRDRFSDYVMWSDLVSKVAQAQMGVVTVKKNSSSLNSEIFECFLKDREILLPMSQSVWQKSVSGLRFCLQWFWNKIL